MTLPDGFATNLLAGAAQLLVGFDIGLAWRASGDYAGVTGDPIFDTMMPDQPGRLVVLATYPLTDDPTRAQSLIGLQYRTRGATKDPHEVRDLDDAIWDRLLGNYPLTLPNGLRIATLSSGPRTGPGQEQGGARRWICTSNVRLDVYRPTPHRH